MSHKTDGNLAALNAYLRQEDERDAAQERLEEARQELADALFDAYVGGDGNVIIEVDDILTDVDQTDWLLNKLRLAMTKECSRPVMGRGGEIYQAYLDVLSDACETIAKRCKTEEDFDSYYQDFKL